MEQPKVPVRVVVCAANKHPKNDDIILGARHFDTIMVSTINRMYDDACWIEWGEGFIDQWGVFMDRKEALQVATDAEQINVHRPKGFPLTELFSEDLY